MAQSKGAINIGSVRKSNIFVRKTACQKYFLQILSQKNAQIVNLKNPDLDLIRDSTQSVDFKDHDSFLESEIQIWISPKTHPFTSVAIVLESENNRHTCKLHLWS